MPKASLVNRLLLLETGIVNKYLSGEWYAKLKNQEPSLAKLVRGMPGSKATAFKPLSPYKRLSSLVNKTLQSLLSA